MKPRAALTGALLLLAGCGQSDNQDAVDAVDAAASPVAPNLVPATSAAPVNGRATDADLAVLESRDCGTVARAFAAAIESKATSYAALFWAPDATGKGAFMDAAAKLDGPVLTIGEISQEGAAGSLYCTVSYTLTTSANAAANPLAGELVLKRVNDVDGATPEQLRWTIRSMTGAFPSAPVLAH